MNVSRALSGRYFEALVALENYALVEPDADAFISLSELYFESGISSSQC